MGEESDSGGQTVLCRPQHADDELAAGLSERTGT